MGTRFGVLALLEVADMNGDELAAALAAWGGSAVTVDRTEIGETLDRLAQEGLVAVVTEHGPEPGRVRAAYTSTSTGRQTLADWFVGDPGEATAPRPELLAKILLSLPSGWERALEVIVHQRSSLTTTLQARRRAARRPTGRGPAAPRSLEGLEALPPVLVDEARFTQAEAELRWLDLCESRLYAARQDDTRLHGGGAA